MRTHHALQPRTPEQASYSIGRRDGKHFAMDHAAIMAKYGDRIKMVQRIPKALSGAMADMMYLANMRTEEEKAAYYRDLLATK